jgi:hypothetical protein
LKCTASAGRVRGATNPCAVSLSRTFVRSGALQEIINAANAAGVLLAVVCSMSTAYTLPKNHQASTPKSKQHTGSSNNVDDNHDSSNTIDDNHDRSNPTNNNNSNSNT